MKQAQLWVVRHVQKKKEEKAPAPLVWGTGVAALGRLTHALPGAVPVLSSGRGGPEMEPTAPAPNITRKSQSLAPSSGSGLPNPKAGRVLGVVGALVQNKASTICSTPNFLAPAICCAELQPCS